MCPLNFGLATAKRSAEQNDKLLKKKQKTYLSLGKADRIAYVGVQGQQM